MNTSASHTALYRVGFFVTVPGLIGIVLVAFSGVSLIASTQTDRRTRLAFFSDHVYVTLETVVSDDRSAR